MVPEIAPRRPRSSDPVGEQDPRARHQSSTVVPVAGEVDLATADRVLDRLLEALARHHEVVADLSGVTFMDCAGLHAFEVAREYADLTGRCLTLDRPSPSAARLLHLTGLEGELTIHPLKERVHTSDSAPGHKGPRRQRDAP